MPIPAATQFPPTLGSTSTDTHMPNVPQEIWENVSNGMCYVQKFDRFGNTLSEGIAPGMKVTISTDDRKSNEIRVADHRFNTFRNGTLMPVAIEGADDKDELAANPNLLSEAEMRALFRTKAETFHERLNAIENLGTLNRLAAFAQDDDSAKVFQVKAITKRQGELQEWNVNEHEIVAGPKKPINPYAGERRAFSE